MIFHIDTMLPALEVNGMALLQENQWLKLLSSFSPYFLQCFQLFVHCEASSICNPRTRPLHP